MAKGLFSVRIHPESGSHVVIVLLAESEREAEEKARERAGLLADAPDRTDLLAAPAVVRECSKEEEVVIVRI
jgi:hypothetical protein